MARHVESQEEHDSQKLKRLRNPRYLIFGASQTVSFLHKARCMEVVKLSQSSRQCLCMLTRAWLCCKSSRFVFVVFDVFRAGKEQEKLLEPFALLDLEYDGLDEQKAGAGLGNKGE